MCLLYFTFIIILQCTSTYKTVNVLDWGGGLVVECLFSMFYVLHLIPSTTHTQKQKWFFGCFFFFVKQYASYDVSCLH
jgi:hypothetical protein